MDGGERRRMLAGLANATFLEHMPWFSRLYAEEIELRDGYAVVPERPGWGFSLDPQAVARFQL